GASTSLWSGRCGPVPCGQVKASMHGRVPLLHPAGSYRRQVALFIDVEELDPPPRWVQEQFDAAVAAIVVVAAEPADAVTPARRARQDRRLIPVHGNTPPRDQSSSCPAGLYVSGLGRAVHRRAPAPRRGL